MSESTSAVFVDVLRATTTLLAVGAAGARGIYVDVKPEGSHYPFIAPEALSGFGPWVFGGELNGSPISGVGGNGEKVPGVIGNSPVDINRAALSGKYLRFFSTNGSKILRAVIEGNMPVICALGMANIEVTVKRLLDSNPKRIWFTCGGFYGSQTLEDSVAAGLAVEALIEAGFAEEDELDDEARMMLMSSRYFKTQGEFNGSELVAKLEQGQVGKLLINIGRQADIAASITGVGIEPDLRDAMSRTVLEVASNSGPLLVASTREVVK